MKKERGINAPINLPLTPRQMARQFLMNLMPSKRALSVFQQCVMMEKALQPVH
nr:MAG TPA: hypothetical protein [Caudoviricetes sp.]